MKLILLPGMDGSGELFAPFIREFSGTTHVVRYPFERLGYAALEALARRELPMQEDFMLLGESFSGPVAIAIAADPPQNLKGLLLCCTFASTPRPLLAHLRHLLRFAPAPPLSVLEFLLCGRFANAEVRALLGQAMGRVPLAVLKDRARAAAEVNVLVQLRAVQMPVLYLKAAEDRVVPPAAFAEIASVLPSVHCVELVAPHFLLQTMPKQTALAITEFLSTGSHAT
jgi:pimeloyl-[acyl-carrier protein] methyl ester esterase